MTVPWSSVACPACAAQPTERCRSAYPFLQVDGPTYLVNPHAERLDAAAFLAATVDGLPEDRAPLTDAQILATGEV